MLSLGLPSIHGQQYGTISDNIIIDPGNDAINPVVIETDGRLNLGGSSSGNKLHVSGNTQITGELQAESVTYTKATFDFQTVSANVTLGDASMVFVDTSSGNLELKLPSELDGLVLNVRHIKGNHDILLTGDNTLVENDVNLKIHSSLLPYSGIELLSCGNHYYILSQSANTLVPSLRQLPSLIHWWDGDDIDGDGSSEGLLESGLTSGNVAAWQDKGLFSANLYQSDINYMPKYIAHGTSNKSYLEFDNDFFLNQGSHDWGKGEAFFVFYRSETDIGTPDSWFINQEFNGRNAIWVEGSSGSLSINSGGGLVMFHGSSNVSLNGSLGGAGNFLTWSVGHGYNYSDKGSRTGIQVSGRNQVSNDRDFEGYIGELIIFSSVLSTEHRQLVNLYLRNKWGVSW
jgi:hypothetical protein